MKELAIVLNMDTNGLGVTRSLGRFGMPVFGADHNDKSVEYFSKYCNKKLLLPIPTSHTQDSAETLLRKGENLDRKTALLPTSVAYVILISQFQKELSKYFNLIVQLQIFLLGSYSTYLEHRIIK
jgi:predicted ATP-grasp superfamily ATP-dependent carboligase